MDTSSAIRWTLDGHRLTISHPDKLYWPADGITKRAMLEYYRTMASVLLPWFKDRPVTIRTFPDGIEGFSYYRRDLPERTPSWLRSGRYRTATTGTDIQVPLIDDAAGLVWFGNRGGIEFHLWASRMPHPDHPDLAVFDLDPGPATPFANVLQATLLLRAYLEDLGLRSYPKTSGARGLHVYLPIAAGHTFARVRGFVRTVTTALARNHPELMAIPHGGTHRGAGVRIDYAQNSIARNTAAPYTVRARAGAPVSTPLSWTEVNGGRSFPTA